MIKIDYFALQRYRSYIKFNLSLRNSEASIRLSKLDNLFKKKCCVLILSRFFRLIQFNLVANFS